MRFKFIVLFLSGLFLSQPPAAAQESPRHGRTELLKGIVESYFTAFNGGEAGMKKYFLENLSKSSLDARPLETRMDIYHDLKRDMGAIEVKKIDSYPGNDLSALVRTEKNDWFRFTFEFGSGPESKIEKIRIEDTEENGEAPVRNISETEALTAIAQYVDGEVKKDLFSGVVLIAKKGKELFKRAYGSASKEFNVGNRPDTKFNLGSINKIFTQIAIGQLCEKGKISYDDPVGKYFPDYPNKEAAGKVTVRHLLDMTSGVGDFFGDKFDNTPKDRFRRIDDFLPMFADDPLKFEPGSRREYSNGGFILLGGMIERASGENYHDYVNDHIFQPAGMTNSGSYQADMPVANLAEGYTRDSVTFPWRKNIYSRPARGSSAGGGYSTAEDMLKFSVALGKNLFFKNPDTWNVLRGERQGAGGKQAEGFGFFGGAPGINSGIETGVGNGYTVIVMSNYDPPAAMDLSKMIRSVLRGVN